MSNQTALTNQEIINKLVDFDDKWEGDSLTNFECKFLDTITRLNKSQFTGSLSSGQREHGLRILEKYDWLDRG